MRLSFGTIKVVTVLGTTAAMLYGALGAASAAPATPVPVSAPAAGSSWSQADYNAAMSRANLAERILTPSTVARVRSLHSLAAPPGRPSDFCAQTGFASPLLAGKYLYAAAGDWVTKYNAATGQVVWRRIANPDRRGEATNIALAVTHGVVVLGQLDCVSHSAPRAYIETFDAITGARGWSAYYNDLPILHMVVSGGYIVTVGNSAEAGNVLAVRNVATGGQVWAHIAGEQCVPSALVAAGLVIAPRCGRSPSLVASKLTTGARVWRLAGSWQIQRGDTDTTASRVVYATDPSGTLAALNPRTGKTLYSIAGAGQVLAVDNARAYAQCDGGNGICAYDTATGQMQWDAAPGAAPVSLAAEAGGVLYLGQGQVLNSATGKTITYLWDVYPPASELAVGQGRIVVVTDPRVLDLYGLPAQHNPQR